MRKRKADELRPRRSPSQTRSRATVDGILTAAARIFARDGFATGTTNRIAELAGVSIGSLYEYFPNKQALLVDCWTRRLTKPPLESGRRPMPRCARHCRCESRSRSWCAR